MRKLISELRVAVAILIQVWSDIKIAHSLRMKREAKTPQEEELRECVCDILTENNKLSEYWEGIGDEEWV
jgi:hypothetical protein